MKTALATLPLPSFFNPKNAREWSYQPDMANLFTEARAWRKQFGIKPAGGDTTRIELLIIDGQKDFCFPQGSLYVGGRSGMGAMDDNARLAEFMYRNAGRITNTRTTLDTHFLFQIFFSWFWVTAQGEPLQAHTMIRVSDDGKQLLNITPAGDILNEGVLPNKAMANWISNGNYGWLCDYVLHYCQSLQKGGRYMLYLWPPHCLLGSEGHALAGVLYEARMFHGLLRDTQSWSEVKGGNFLTENYSVFKPEVLMTHDDRAIGQRNTRFLKVLIDADVVVIAGQADSHCVKSSIDDLLDEINAQDPTLASKVYILKDCTSAVAVPDGKGGFIADFTPQAEEAHTKFAAAGMHLVNSTEPIESWPGIKLG